MEITCEGVQTRLHGLKHPHFHDPTTSSLQRHTRAQNVSQYLHLLVSLDVVDLDQHLHPSTILTPDTPPLFVDQINLLLLRYEDFFFSFPTGLPPVRAFDHHIFLLPEVTPVNVCPYRYPHSQKEEIECLVGEMLNEGIIRPSSSPFSSLVILIKKKDCSW